MVLPLAMSYSISGSIATILADCTIAFTDVFNVLSISGSIATMILREIWRDCDHACNVLSISGSIATMILREIWRDCDHACNVLSISGSIATGSLSCRPTGFISIVALCLIGSEISSFPPKKLGFAPGYLFKLVMTMPYPAAFINA